MGFGFCGVASFLIRRRNIRQPHTFPGRASSLLPFRCHARRLFASVPLSATQGLELDICRSAPDFSTSEFAANLVDLPALSTGRHLDIFVDISRGHGGRLWPSSAILCRWLRDQDFITGARVLELGTGTGAVGLYAAGCGAAHVTLTDACQEVLDLAQKNHACAMAAGIIPADTVVECLQYKWGDPVAAGNYDWVVGSDLTYSVKLHVALMDTIASLLKVDGPRVVLAHADRLSFQLENLAQEAQARELHLETIYMEPGPQRQAIYLLEVIPRSKIECLKQG